MADLLDVAEVGVYVGVDDPDDDALLQSLITKAIAAFQASIGRTGRPYAADPAIARIETRDGTGSRDLWLDYPVAALTMPILIGHDSANPTETLDPADPAVLSWKVGSRRVTRVDGGWFGCLGSPNDVQVTYDAQADPLPEDVKFAVIRYIGAAYRESGRPEATGERVLDETAPLPFVADRDPTWTAAVDNHREVTV